MAIQWWQKNKELLLAEHKALEAILKGNPYRWSFEDNTGNLCLDVILTPFEKNDDYTEYFIRMMYMPNHPSKEYGYSGSIRVYPKGKFKEKIEEFIRKGELPPHLIKDHDRNEYYICGAQPEYFKTGKTITSGAVMLNAALIYISLFHLTALGKISFDDWRHDFLFQV